MPYSSIAEIPKGLKGAGLSLAQANVWAKINDHAEAGGAREPAAVAWSQFKKLYKKVGDKWVKRATKLMKISTPLDELSEWPKDWEIPEEIITIRLSDKQEIEIPYIIKDRIILKEGVANGLFYPGEELEPNVEVLNEKPDPEDVEARKRTSLFWDHDDACKNWLGEAKNFRWDPEQKAIIADVHLVDEDAAKKTYYQLEESEDGLSRWGISPRVKINEQDGRATDIRFISQALVLDPAGGPKLMLEKDKFEHAGEEIQNEEPSVAWVCEKCGYSEAVEEEEKDEKIKECPKCDGQMKQKKEARNPEEELYQDLELESEENKETMQFEQNNQDMKLLAKEFGLTEEEIANFEEEQLELLRSVPKTEDILEDDKEQFECECISCGYKIKSEKHCMEISCPKCGAQMRRASRPGPGQPSPEEQSTIRNYIESFSPILKIDGDEHIVKMIVLEPEVVDNHGHVVSEEEIQSAMYLWMEQYKNTEVMHRDRAGNLFPMEEKILGPDDDLWKHGWNNEFAILECYQSPIDYFEGDEIVRKGSWVLTLRVNDENIWQKIKNKELTGASIGGHAALSAEVV